MQLSNIHPNSHPYTYYVHGEGICRIVTYPVFQGMQGISIPYYIIHRRIRSGHLIQDIQSFISVLPFPHARDYFRYLHMVRGTLEVAPYPKCNQETTELL